MNLNVNPYPPGLSDANIQWTGNDTAAFSWDPSLDPTVVFGNKYDVVVRVTDTFDGNYADQVLTLEIVPEPSTVLMMVSMGIMGLLVWWRRRSKV